MKYLLDANAVIAVLRGHPGLLDRMRREEPTDLGLPAIVAHELYFGAFKSDRLEGGVERLEGLEFPLVSFDREDARRSGMLRAALAGLGRPIGGLDVLIAGQALARDLALITHNTREFGRVPGLRVEDWET
ncbi:MAG: PIN domain-containing protein [Caulobacteraceae bacterium]